MRSSRSVETTLNVKLAAILRGQHLDAEAERRVRKAQFDILLSRDDDLVAIEAEFEPARTVRADADSRMGRQVDGKPVTLVTALVYPERLRNVSDAEIERELQDCQDLRFSFGEPTGSDSQMSLIARNQPGSLRWTPWETGSVWTLSTHMWTRWTQSQRTENELARLTQILDERIVEAAAILQVSPGSSGRVVKALELDALGLEERAALRASALILCNAMVFQRLLSNIVEELPTGGAFGQRQAAQQWKKILRTNWRPIFEPARRAVLDMDSTTAYKVLEALQPAAEELSSSNIPARHDLAGRVFHSLLIGGKYLSPNYTTVPSAILLASLALNCLDLDWSDEKAIRALNIVDPACGTGTLLAAAGQDIRRRHIRARLDAGDKPSAVLNRTLLEDVLYGYDVVHAVVHLAAATLAMMEVKRKIRRTHLYPMPLKVDKRGKKKTPRLGSLDFLSTSETEPWPLDLFAGKQAPEKKESRSVSGNSEKKRVAELPPIDLAILNPPFFKSQGIVDSRGWKPFFGMMANPKDADLMRKELQRRLQPLPASMKAGGSAFIQLVEENLRGDGSVLACVLPTAVWTGSSWAGVRRLWAERYAIEWVVVSHDDRNRTKTASTPGRLFISMSESTRIGETLIVARRKTTDHENSHYTRIVNLRINPDHPIKAAQLTRLLSELEDDDMPILGQEYGGQCSLMDIGPGHTKAERQIWWGEVLRVALPRNGEDIGNIIGPATALRSTIPILTAWRISQGKLGEKDLPFSIAKIGDIAATGPWHHAVKGGAGPYTIQETLEATGNLALWHHEAESITKLNARPNAQLLIRPGRENEAGEVWKSSGSLHIALELRLASQRAAAVWSKRRMLGISSWNTLRLKGEYAQPNREKALALWFNSTLGILLRIVHGNRPYLGRVRLPIEVLRRLPVLDVTKLGAEECEAAGRLWNDVARRELLPYAQAHEDPVRQEIDHRMSTEVLGLPEHSAEFFGSLRNQLVGEPMVWARF